MTRSAFLLHNGFMRSALTYIWQQVIKHIGLLFVLLTMVVLRLPNFLEPYWYGDEAIYLTIGNAINRGSLLYTDIVDHKTPLIYYLAALPDQFSFRLLLTAWMVITLALYYCFSRKILRKTTYALVATMFVMLLTTLPWFEGHIPNGELFVMGFVMMGAFILRYSRVFGLVNQLQPSLASTQKHDINALVNDFKQGGAGFAHDNWLLLVSGMFFGFALLTKVPALLDIGAFLAIFWFLIVNLGFNYSFKHLRTLFPTIVLRLFVFALGILLPMVASVAYFTALGSGKDYLDYALLYNFHYSGTWKLQLATPLLTWLFTMGAKMLLMFVSFAFITALTKKISFRLQFAVSWFVLALFATLLSNRPYPHYFIQLLPSLGLLLAMAVEGAVELIAYTKKHTKINRLGMRVGIPSILFATLAFWTTSWVLLTLNVGLYPVMKYYISAWLYHNQEISETAYFDGFDALVNENYQVAEIINQLQLRELFIWGTNPMLYAQTKTVPTSRFTVAFHIKDVNDFQPTLQKIKLSKPRMIIVMKNEAESFPELNQYLARNYLVNYQYRHMTLYLRRLEQDTRELTKLN